MIGWILVGLAALVVVAGLITSNVLRHKAKERQKTEDAINAFIVSTIDRVNNRVTLQDLESREEFTVEGGGIEEEISENLIIIGDDSQFTEFDVLKGVGYTNANALKELGLKNRTSLVELRTNDIPENDMPGNEIFGLARSTRNPDAYYVNVLDIVALKNSVEKADMGTSVVRWVNRKQRRVGLQDVRSGREIKITGQRIADEVQRDILVFP